jgi:hypothetical protein
LTANVSVSEKVETLDSLCRVSLVSCVLADYGRVLSLARSFMSMYNS